MPVQDEGEEKDEDKEEEVVVFSYEIHWNIMMRRNGGG